MAFTDDEKVAIRRFCGYPVYGGEPSAFQSYRFFQAYGLLEYRMQHLLSAEEAVVRDVYLANLTTLETAIPATSDNLDTDQAAVWHHNKNEQRDRERLFASWRERLAAFLGVPMGPYTTNGAAGGSIQLVV